MNSYNFFKHFNLIKNNPWKGVLNFQEKQLKKHFAFTLQIYKHLKLLLWAFRFISCLTENVITKACLKREINLMSTSCFNFLFPDMSNLWFNKCCCLELLQSIEQSISYSNTESKQYEIYRIIRKEQSAIVFWFCDV